MAAKRQRGGAGRRFGHVLGALLILLLLGCCVYLFYDRSEMPSSTRAASAPVPVATPAQPTPEPTPTPTPEPTPTPVTVLFVTGEREEALSVPVGEELELPMGEELAGQRFFGWRGEDGVLLAAGTVISEPSDGLRFEAVYRVALGGTSHTAYLPAGEDGLLRPDDLMTRADAALMLYALLPEEARPEAKEANFSDLSEEDACYTACAALRALGALEGESFYPTEPLSRGALLSMLRPFFPEAAEDFSFADLSAEDEGYDAFCLAAERGWIEVTEAMEVLPQELLSRLQTAKLMNRVLERSADPAILEEDLAGMADLPENREDALALLEAAIPHEAELTDEGERWIDPEELWMPIPGFTTGDTEVDAWLKKIIDDKVDESKPQRDQLLALYIYVRDTFRYRKGELYEEAAPDILLAETRKMMEEEGGNCYTHSALMCQLLRARGLEAKVCCGTIGNDFSPHAWVEAEIDGTTYVFDPEMEKTNFRFHHPYFNFFMRTEYDVKGWDYQEAFVLE